jgi:hypothetical protein
VTGRPSAAIAPIPVESVPNPLADLPGIHAELTQAVLTRALGSQSAAFGSGLPIRAAVHDLLYSSDHFGHLGIVPGLVAMERVTRLALGDSLPGKDREDRAVARACTYLTAQTERLLAQAAWSTDATAEVANVLDETLSRVDPERVRLDWETVVRRSTDRIAELDATVPEDAAHMGEIEAERAACVDATRQDYIDYEGQLFDAISAYFTAAGSNPFDWYGFVVAETAWMLATARSLLGLAEHSQRRVIECPMCEKGRIGLTADPDEVDCDACARVWTLSDGKADAFFGAFRAAGWSPRRVA